VQATELIAGAGQSDVEPLPGPQVALLVNDKDNAATFQTFEPENVTVEHLLRVPEAVPAKRRTELCEFRVVAIIHSMTVTQTRFGNRVTVRFGHTNAPKRL
jgi:hypothetical protein